MKKQYLIKGLVAALVGLGFILAAFLTEGPLEGLLWGFGGGILVPGLGMLLRYLYWRSPSRAALWEERELKEEIIQHDELYVRLREKSGHIAYLVGVLTLSLSLVLVTFLGKLGYMEGYLSALICLWILLLVQILAGVLAMVWVKKRYGWTG